VPAPVQPVVDGVNGLLDQAGGAADDVLGGVVK
jgi:hypothetical protein